MPFRGGSEIRGKKKKLKRNYYYIIARLIGAEGRELGVAMIFRSTKGPWKSLARVYRAGRRGVETRGVNVGETEEGLRDDDDDDERRGADAVARLHPNTDWSMKSRRQRRHETRCAS